MVYKARCHRLNRLVAIKILKEELAQDAEFRRRFHDESQAVAMLSHPNIMAVYDVSKSGDVDYIVMELLEALPSSSICSKKGGKLSWKESLHFIIQIMKALSHAHSRGIIHRDIKPHNIMVLRDGSIKVADFGIARLTSASQNTMTQEALGSVHLHLLRSRPRKPHRRPLRHLLRGRGALRDADRKAAVRGRFPGGGGYPAHQLHSALAP